MNILFYQPSLNFDEWSADLQAQLPQAKVRMWQPGDTQPADYVLTWKPPYEMMANRTDLKAVMILGAGVDGILDQEKEHPGTLPAGVPLVRLEDTGMGLQMQEYALYSVLRYFRRMDEYQALQQKKSWQRLKPHQRDQFVIGIMGAGVLGKSVADSLVALGFEVRCWSRTAKQIDGVTSYAGRLQLVEFLKGTQLVINLLPNTPETQGILNSALFEQLNPQAYLINLARGVHLVESDLLHALEQGQIAGATLDVFAQEPLQEAHPFWHHPLVTITPHIAAFTTPTEAIEQITANIRTIEQGGIPVGLVDRVRGY